MIDRFRAEGRNFLVLSSAKPGDHPLVDISHESLIRQWQTLRDWVDEEAAGAKLYRRLAETTALHAERRAGLYRDADVEQALAWQKRYQPNPDWARRYPGHFGQAMAFIRESRLARCTDARTKKHARVERERLLREKAELAERQARQEREARRKARRWTAAATHKTTSGPCSRPSRPSASGPGASRRCDSRRATHSLRVRWSVPSPSAGPRRA